MGQNGHDGLSENELGGREEDKAEECRSSHRSFRVVEETEDALVVELVRVVGNEEVAYTQREY